MLSALLCITATAVTREFTPYNGALLNPDRGFYIHTKNHASSPAPLQVSVLESYTKQGINLIFRSFVLDRFINSEISATFLKAIAADFEALRVSGVNVVLRFCYTTTYTTPYGDATPEIIQKHIAQVKPLIQSYIEIITVFQNGWIGTWGEAYYTDHFGGPTDYPLKDVYVQRRRALAHDMLDAVAPHRSIASRTVGQRIMVTNRPTPLTEAEALDPKVNSSRVFLFDDAFVSSVQGSGSSQYADDMGTYASNAERVLYHTDSKYGINGGESAAFCPYSACSTSKNDLAYFHYSYLNSEYHPDVLAGWKKEGCYDEIAKTLGYRFSLKNVSTHTVNGNAYVITFHGWNDGYATARNPRGFRLIASAPSLGTCIQNITHLDIRHWVGGRQSFSENFTISFPVDVSDTVSFSFEIYDFHGPYTIHPLRRIVFANQETVDAAGKNRINAVFQDKLQLKSGVSGYTLHCSK